MNFVKVGELSEVPAGKMRMYRVGEKEYLVANVNGNYFAIGNRCTHANADLSHGSIEGNIVTRPKHKSKFDVTTGRVVSGPKMPPINPKINDEPSFKVKVEDNAILLGIE